MFKNTDWVLLFLPNTKEKIGSIQREDQINYAKNMILNWVNNLQKSIVNQTEENLKKIDDKFSKSVVSITLSI